MWDTKFYSLSKTCHVIIITSVEGSRLCFHLVSVCPLDYSKSYKRILMKLLGEVAVVQG